jgi:hypothetical protein
MPTLKAILNEIAEGRTSFRPKSNTTEHLIEFQPTAKALCFALQEGYLVGCQLHKESETGSDWYDRIVVTNGLSHKGEEFRNRESTSGEKVLEEIIQIKPSIYGVGINFNALWKHWKSRREKNAIKTNEPPQIIKFKRQPHINSSAS